MGKYSSDSDSSDRKSRRRKRSSSSSPDRRGHSRKSKHGSSSHRDRQSRKSPTRYRSRRSHSRSSRRSFSRDRRRRRSTSRKRQSSRDRRRSSSKNSRRSRSRTRQRSRDRNKRHYRRDKRSSSSSSSSASSTVPVTKVKDKDGADALREKLLQAIKAAENADLELKKQGALPTNVRSRNQIPDLPSVPDSNSLNEIESDGFIPKTFKSSKSKGADKFELSNKNNAENPDETKLPSNSNIFGDPQAKMDRWVKKLFLYRQRALNAGSPK